MGSPPSTSIPAPHRSRGGAVILYKTRSSPGGTGRFVQNDRRGFEPMSDPFGRMGGMTETYVTATDFRSHVAQITNCVAWRHDRVVVTRHGQEIGGFVCHEDLEFL